MQITEIAEKASPILEKSGVTFAGVFGSHARGEGRPGSDVDLLIRLKAPIGMFKLVGLEQELSDRLGVPVDLVTEGALSPYIRESVLRDLKTVYGAR